MHKLKEIRHILQDSPDLSKRWFTSDKQDLFVWLGKDKVIAFEYCYNKFNLEHMLCWRQDGQINHSRIDVGDHPGRHKRSPISVPDGNLDPLQLALQFEVSGNLIEPSIYRQILISLYNLQVI